MTVQAILAPVFALVLLLFILMVWLGRKRFVAVRGKQVQPRADTPGSYIWPREAQLASDALKNHFEMPVLFYALVPLAMITRKADLLFVVMSWIFVVTRYLHAFEHVGSNRLKFRFPLFAVGVATLFAMWLIFAIRILTEV